MKIDIATAVQLTVMLHSCILRCGIPHTLFTYGNISLHTGCNCYHITRNVTFVLNIKYHIIIVSFSSLSYVNVNTGYKL